MSLLATEPSYAAATPCGAADAPATPRGVVVFDFEHTLLASAALAPAKTTALVRHAFHPEQASDRITLAAARVRAARSLGAAARAALLPELQKLRLAPAAQSSIARLQRFGISCALVSLGWDFVLEALAPRLGIEHYLGTGLEPGGAVVHVWSEDRAEFTRRLGEQLSLPAERTLLVTQRQPLPALADQLIRRWR